MEFLNRSIIALSLCTALLTACGGGSDSSTTSPGSSSIQSSSSSVSSTNSSSSSSPDVALAVPINIAVNFLPVKTLQFTWAEVEGATSYTLLSNSDDDSQFDVLISGIESTTYELEVALHRSSGMIFRLQACNDNGCSDQSDSVTIDANMLESVGYFKAPITRGSLFFYDELGQVRQFSQRLGTPVLSEDGNTLVIVNGADYSDVPDLSADINLQWPYIHHAVYIFRRLENDWHQQANLKCRADEPDYSFSTARPAVAISSNGKTLAVGVPSSWSVFGYATGKTGGFVCIFKKESSTWSQVAKIQSSKSAAVDGFGGTVSLSADGKTLAVGATGDAGMGVGVNGEADSLPSSIFNGSTVVGAFRGAAFIFRELDGVWNEEVYLKAMDANVPSVSLGFGSELELSKDGAAVAVSIDGYIFTDETQSAESLLYERVYIYRKIDGVWTFEQTLGQEIRGTSFGDSLSFTADGRTLVIGESYSRYSMFNPGEDLNGQGRVGVYVSEQGQWTRKSTLFPDGILKATRFGSSVMITPDGQHIAVCAPADASSAMGVGGNPDDLSAPGSGAAYFFSLKEDDWHQQAYIKSSNTDAEDYFCSSLALSADANTLAIGAIGEDSAAEGINGNMQDNSADNSGAVYLY